MELEKLDAQRARTPPQHRSSVTQQKQSDLISFDSKEELAVNADSANSDTEDEHDSAV